MVGYKVEQGVAILEVAQPPLNGLSRAVRAALMDAVDRAEEDDSAGAILLVGAGASFPAGAEVSEYDSHPVDPSLRDLCERVEFSEKPVVAALAGTVHGGGLELALAAHYRVARAGTRLGFPDIHLGLPPCGGGSQRLPRLVGAAQALDMLIGGRLYPVDTAEGRKLVDTLTDGDVRLAGLAFCAKLLAADGGARPLSARMPGADDPMRFQQEIAARRAGFDGDPDSAEAQILTLVEASALLPFQAGLELEGELFQDCLTSERSRGLRHAHLAERRAARFDGVPKNPSGAQVLAVLGAGSLAVQIVLAALNAGLTVRWGGKDAALMQRSQAQLDEVFDKAAARGGGDAQAAQQRRARLTTGSSEDMAQGADTVLMAVPGQANVPLQNGAVRLQAFAAPVKGTGLRFVPPVHATRLVEVLQGPQSQPAELARAAALAAQLGKVPVHVHSDHDTLAGRLAAALHRAADGLLDMGASPYDIDVALTGWGLPSGPFAARDRRGLGDFARITRVQGRNWSALVHAQGRTGRAEGRGFYDWSDGQPEPAQPVQALLADQRPDQAFSSGRIVSIMLGAMANEGLRLITEGKAQRASDLDLVSLLALEIPRHRGGVMKAVSLRGLLSVKKELERLDHRDRAFWALHPDWARLIRNGQGFDAL
ncbi:enoyl-CoA hydratase/isomerase family protein [Tropicibacter oceani]|uniref:Enoyl-CoA hydratase-related protein n=1 Tax=Tropicibacter oceani TaxID=3058420 RepID=A0ABY8QGM0_9RHOB|nr:enoyl-CoA hydratase/isomerase family protein [Tropicibacter oceani]WGW03779.1 enoyl-CoA hydratase-related protein [Tropicibacter oceani]